MVTFVRVGEVTMNKVGGGVMLLVLGLATSPILGACAVDTAAEGDQVELSDPQGLSGVSAKKVTLTCGDWNSACRAQLGQKLRASKARNPEATLAAMDRFATAKTYSAASEVPGPPGFSFCGFGLCCSDNTGAIDCHFEWMIGVKVEW